MLNENASNWPTKQLQSSFLGWFLGGSFNVQPYSQCFLNNSLTSQSVMVIWSQEETIHVHNYYSMLKI
jgi:hypothetical protein